MSNELEDLANFYYCDKGTIHLPGRIVGHGFTDTYYEIWKDIRYEVENVLEIGIYHGAGLKTLRDFFLNATIYGIDVQTFPSDGLYDIGRVETSLCNQIDRPRLEELFKDKSFDIILDDGGHNTIYQQKSLAYLFKFVKPGGMYIVEDLHTSLMGSVWGLPPEDPYTCLKVLRNFEETGKIYTPHIEKEDLHYLNEQIKDVKVVDTKRTICQPLSQKCDLTSIIMKEEVYNSGAGDEDNA